MLKKQTEFARCSLNQSWENWPSNCACGQAEREGDHVILSLTFEFLFQFQNGIFLQFFVQISSCSNIKLLEVWGSTVFSELMTLLHKLCFWCIIFFHSGMNTTVNMINDLEMMIRSWDKVQSIKVQHLHVHYLVVTMQYLNHRRQQN
jgi:hypothetical protein